MGKGSLIGGDREECKPKKKKSQCGLDFQEGKRNEVEGGVSSLKIDVDKNTNMKNNEARHGLYLYSQHLRS